MDYQVSARKYRPGVFQDVIGQSHVVQTLVNAITTKRIAHAFLFSGTRGVGKTTVARILAKALNCEQGPTGTPCNSCPNCAEITQGTSVDVIEIDGASNTSVDDVREVRENVKFAPFRGQYRVYIIDEVHMLSNSAFNALLKTLEEPPAHVVFVFATTEIHKIPATILSRCQHYNFRRITRAEIIDRLRLVAEEEGITVEERSLTALARASEGSMRDALSLLDQAVAFGGKAIQHTDLETLLGSVPQERVQAMISAIVAQDSPGAIRVIAALLDQGHDLRAYCGDVVEHVRNLLVAAVVSSPQEVGTLMEASEEELNQIRTNAKAFTPEQLQELFRIFSQAEDSLRVTAHPRFVMEIAAIRATRLPGVGPATSVQPVTSKQIAEKPPQSDVSRQSLPRDGASSEKAASAQSASSPSGEGSRPSVAPEVGNSATRGLKAGSPDMRLSARSQPRDAATMHTTSSPPASAAVLAAEPGDGSAVDEAKSSTASVKLDWGQVQEEVAGAHPNIGSFLDRGVLVNIEGNLVTVGYSKADTVARAVIEKPDNLDTLTKVCERLSGGSVRIKVIELADAQPACLSRAQSRAAKAQEQKLVLLERTRSHPLVKQALDIFGGELIDVRRAPLEKEVGE